MEVSRQTQSASFLFQAPPGYLWLVSSKAKLEIIGLDTSFPVTTETYS